MKSIIEQLYDIYINHEWWHKSKLSFDQFDLYTQKLISQGNLFYEVIDDKVVAYTEVWLINFEQFGRLICDAPFSAYEEDVTSGNLAYVANVWCDENYRRGDSIKLMKKEFFDKTQACDYFVGEAKRKKTQPVKVFKRADLMRFNKER